MSNDVRPAHFSPQRGSGAVKGKNPLFNREAWLTSLGRMVVEHVFAQYDVGEFRVSCGFPSRSRVGKNRIIGECHSSRASRDGVCEIFVSPLLDSPLKVAGTLCHEIAHVVAGTEAGHGPQFYKVCQNVGLTVGKPTHAGPGKALSMDLMSMIARLPEYPHSALSPAVLFRARARKSEVSLSCVSCKCRVRMTIKWADIAGHPKCGCGSDMVVVKKGGGD